ncbi:MAG: bifunctional DNA primase/helicase [Dongiaceae bacterium]
MKTIPLKQNHLEILAERGLDAELLSRLGVKSVEKDGDWIAIPFRRQSKIVNHKYRTIAGDKRFQQDKDACKCFWNFDVLADETLASAPLIITEGEFDAMIAIQCGFPRVVSVPDGAPAQELGEGESKKYAYLEDAAELLAGVKEIILCTDGDQPGINLMNDLSVRLGQARCKWVKYPKGCKDLNDAFREYGQKGVKATIERAQWWQIKGVYSMSELPPVPERKVFNIGLPGLEKHYNARPMDFCVVTGIPSHGKTAFINDIACRLVQNHGWNACFASFEQQPQIDHRRNLRTWHGQKRVKDMAAFEIEAADAWIERHFSFIFPGVDDNVTLDWTLERCALAVIRRNARLVVIDPWNEMDHDRPDGMSLTEYTGWAIKQFKLFALKYQVHVIVAAHPAKPLKEPGGKLRRPTLYDISDSAHWYNKADVGIIVHRDDEKQTTIHVAKSRYHDQIGAPGEFKCIFDPSTNRFNQILDSNLCSVRNWNDID